MTFERKRKIICHSIYDSVYEGLKRYEDAGIPLFLEDTRMSATAIAEVWAAGKGGMTFMMDFIPDSTGLKVRGIRVDPILIRRKIK